MSENACVLALKPEFLVTKIGLYQQGNLVFLKSVQHQKDELDSFTTQTDQFEYRADAVINELRKADIHLEDIDIIMARGGLLRPIASGVYEVNEAMKRD